MTSLSRYAQPEEIVAFYAIKVVRACRWPSFPTIKSFRVGGLRFVRIGRLQASFCIVKRKVS